MSLLRRRRVLMERALVDYSHRPRWLLALPALLICLPSDIAFSGPIEFGPITAPAGFVETEPDVFNGNTVGFRTELAAVNPDDTGLEQALGVGFLRFFNSLTSETLANISSKTSTPLLAIDAFSARRPVTFSLPVTSNDPQVRISGITVRFGGTFVEDFDSGRGLFGSFTEFGLADIEAVANLNGQRVPVEFAGERGFPLTGRRGVAPLDLGSDMRATDFNGTADITLAEPVDAANFSASVTLLTHDGDLLLRQPSNISEGFFYTGRQLVHIIDNDTFSASTLDAVIATVHTVIVPRRPPGARVGDVPEPSLLLLLGSGLAGLTALSARRRNS
jgi:PEP-CTERM motif